MVGELHLVNALNFVVTSDFSVIACGLMRNLFVLKHPVDVISHMLQNYAIQVISTWDTCDASVKACPPALQCHLLVPVTLVE